MIEFKHSTVEILDWGCKTYFADGSSFGAHPHETPHYSVISHRCGYGDDLMRYCLEHELCHLICEEWLYDRPSQIIWGLAHGKPLSAVDSVYEESAAQMLQRFVRTNERPIIGGIDWCALKRHALTKLEKIP